MKGSPIAARMIELLGCSVCSATAAGRGSWEFAVRGTVNPAPSRGASRQILNQVSQRLEMYSKGRELIMVTVLLWWRK
jgi:hypothetical protein